MNLEALDGGLNGLDDMDGIGKKLKKLRRNVKKSVSKVTKTVKSKVLPDRWEKNINKAASRAEAIGKAGIMPTKKNLKAAEKAVKATGKSFEKTGKEQGGLILAAVATVVTANPAIGQAINAAWGAGRAVQMAKKAAKKMNNVSGELEYYDERGNRITKAQFDQMEADYARAVAAEKAAKEAAQTKFVQTVNATNPQALTPEVKAEFARTLASNGSGAAAAVALPPIEPKKGVVAWAKENPLSATAVGVGTLKVLSMVLL